MNFLNKMERKFGKYAIPNLMRYVIACYIIGYVIQYFMKDAFSMITLEPFLIIHGGQIWRLVSWVLIPPSRSNIIFIFIMLILYYQLGNALERSWGTFRFNVYIFGGVIWTIIFSFILYAIYGVNNPVSMGAGFSTYFINLTIFLAFACCYPDTRVMLYFIIPIKMRWMAIVYGIFIVVDFIMYGWAGRMAIIAAVVNFLIFFAMLRRMPSFSPKQVHRRHQYQQQVKQPTGVSRHKCAICGKTEIDHPDMQFRFCSKCKGNYEYCQNHLFTHKHIQ